MQSDPLKADLEALRSDSSVPVIRRIERVLPEIEAALRDGVRREAVRQALNERGIKVSPQGFATALYRLRKKARRAGAVAGPLPVAEAAGVAGSDEADPKPRLTPEGVHSLAQRRPDLKHWESIAKKKERGE